MREKYCVRCNAVHKRKSELCAVCAGETKATYQISNSRRRPCEHEEVYNYGEGVTVCARCGKIDKPAEAL